jgi:ABC-type transport system substrate-binding protein
VAATFFALIEGADAVAAGDATEASGIEKIDDQTVSITITEPNQTFLNILAMPFGSILPADSPTNAEEVTANPIGTGPFLLESRESGQQLTFVTNPHYWNPAGQLVAQIDFRVGVDPTSALQQAETGDLDIMADNPPAGQISALLADDTLTDRVFRSSLVAVQFMAMDVSGDTPLNNLLVRQAIASASRRRAFFRHPCPGMTRTATPIRTIPITPETCWPRRGSPMGSKLPCTPPPTTRIPP